MGNILRKGLNAYKQTMHLPKTENAEPAESGQDTQGRQDAQNRQDLNPQKPALGGSAGSIANGKSGLLKTVVPLNEAKVRRVAKFLILVGSQQAAQILGQLDSKQVEEISREIALIDKIEPADAEAVLSEFRSLFSSPYGYSGLHIGGVDAARSILHHAYGAEKGEAILNKTVPESKANIFGFLEEFTAEQIVFLLKDENAGAVALVLARLAPKVSADAIGKLQGEFRNDVLLRIARQQEVSPEVLESVAASLRERARQLGSGSGSDIAIDGMQTLAAILKQGDYSFGDRLLSEIGNEDPEIGKGLKDRLYTLDDILSVFDRPLAEKLKTMDDKDIAILLKGRSAEFVEKILKNVSSGRRKVIEEEGQIMGPVPRRECDDVANGFIAWFRQERAKGGLASADDEDWVK